MIVSRKYYLHYYSQVLVLFDTMTVLGTLIKMHKYYLILRFSDTSITRYYDSEVQVLIAIL